jgi:hypothetical protein
MSEKILAIPAAFLILASTVLAQAEVPSLKKAEISLSLGWGHSRAHGSSHYHFEWVPDRSPFTSADSIISLSANDALYVGALFSLFFCRNFGFQTGFGYLKSDVPNEAAFNLSDVHGASALSKLWQGTGEVTAVPLCMNLAGRFSHRNFELSMSAGAALFLNSFLADSYAGTAAVSPLPGESSDIFRIKIAVEDQTWSALGGNLGGSIDLRLSGSLALTAEARAFFCPTKMFAWKWRSGEYTGLLGNIPRWNFDQASVHEAESGAKPFSLNPSFFTVGLGIKFLR